MYARHRPSPGPFGKKSKEVAGAVVNDDDGASNYS
jgi:hypothetical protein